jgi:Uma2 family endonuclease
MKNTLAYLPENLTRMTDEEFFHFANQMDNVRIERTKQGQIIIMPPTGGETGIKNGKIFGYLFVWNLKTQDGVVFDSSTGFTLADGSVLSPDSAWVGKADWYALPIELRRKFAPVCPAFIVELMSENDELAEAQLKMVRWRENGVQLGWLINPKEEKTYIYRSQATDFEVVTGFDKVLSGESVLPAFALDLKNLNG